MSSQCSRKTANERNHQIFPRALSASPQLVPVETALQTFRVIRGDPSTLFAHAPRSVPGAVQLRDQRLPRMIRVRHAEAELYHALSTRWMDQQTGAAIIGNLFRIFGVNQATTIPNRYWKARSLALLSDELGKQTGSWRPVKATPVTLLIAAQQILQTAIFPPKPAEIVKACREVRKKLQNAHTLCNRWLDDLQNADAILLDFAPEQWVRP